MMMIMIIIIIIIIIIFSDIRQSAKIYFSVFT
jgi:hypothetical protein